jgi:sugar O-acyltransferase (sialic acid O-acetyltransferase NeuD family)
MTDARRVVLFGSGSVAAVARFILEQESAHRVVAVSVDRSHVEQAGEADLPVVPFEEVASRFPPQEFSMFVAVGYRAMNTLRAERYARARSMGYELISHVSPRASVWPGLTIGDNTIIMDGVTIGPFATIGSDCVLWPGSHVGHGARVGDHCYIASLAAVSGMASVGACCFLGTSCVIRDGISVGASCLVGAGAVVTKDLPPEAIVAAPEPRRLPGRSSQLPSF